MFDAVVVGSGLAGSTAARILAEAGWRVLVLEKRRHIGGNVYDEKMDGITVHRYGPHIFHTKYKEVWDFLRKFARFRHYQHRVLSYVEGMYVSFPINVSTLRKVFGRPDLTIEGAKELLKEEVEKSSFNDPPRNFRDAVVSQVGERLYRLFFEGYTRKQWGRDPEELSPDLAKRIPIRFNFDDRYFSDPYQGIPEGGYTEMVRRILDHENISVALNVDYFEIRDMLKANLTVYTGKLDEFFDYSFGKLEYRSLRFETRIYEEEFYQPVAVVNYPSDYDFTRATEYKHFLKEKSRRTVVVYEYPSAEGEPYYIVPSEENARRRERYMKEVEKLEKSGEYIFVGRLAEYRYYNMDEVVKRSMEKLKERLSG